MSSAWVVGAALLRRASRRGRGDTWYPQYQHLPLVYHLCLRKDKGYVSCICMHMRSFNSNYVEVSFSYFFACACLRSRCLYLYSSSGAGPGAPGPEPLFY
eukprot:scaffold11000_cov108-Isochrysis_galbana.AAC.2